MTAPAAGAGSVRATLARALPWAVLGLGLVLATAPAWRPLLLGLEPTLDELLEIVCTAPRARPPG